MSYGSGRNCGSSFGNKSFSQQKPVETGKEYNVQITETSRKGDGIARVQGFVVSVKNAKAGQKVKVKVEKGGNRYATATMAS
jgi:predicted RNA-binding protein with TRAM domain